MEAIDTAYTTPTLPLDIAKVMKPLILGKDAGGSPPIACISARPIEGGTQYIATNGHCMLLIDTDEQRPCLEYAAWSSAQVKTYIESKGHASLESDAELVHSLPDYDQVIPGGEPKPIATIGVNVRYLALMDKISKGFKLRNAHWVCEFHGDMSPMIWKTMTACNHESITGITFVLMPVRIG